MMKKTVALLTLIVGMTFIGYGYLWNQDRIPYSPYSDVVTAHLGNKAVLYHSLQAGKGIPLWRPDQFAGYPALTNPQALYTYPLNFLFYFLPPERAVGGTMWIHFLLAGLGFYFLGAVLDVRFGARLFMAVAGLFSFKLIIAAYAGWLAVIPSIMLLPWLFGAVFYFFKRPSWNRGLLLGLVGGLCLHTGMIQLIYYAACFLGIFAIVQFVRSTSRVKQIVWFMLGSVLSLGLSAYLCIPLLAESPLISRKQASFEFFLAGHALKVSHLLTLFYPEILGTPVNGTYSGSELWEDVAYFGWIPLLLSVAGTVWGSRRFAVRFLTISFFVSLLLSMHTPILKVLFTFWPGFSLFRCPARFTFLSVFFGLALAGIGLDEILKRVAQWRPSRVFPGLITALLVLLVTAEGIYYARRYLTMAPISQVVPETDVQRFLAKDRTLFRVAPFYRSFNCGWAGPMNMQMVTGYDSYNMMPYQTYFDLLQGRNVDETQARVWTDLAEVKRRDMLNALNVKYLISPTPLDLPEMIFEKAGVFYDQPTFVFYKGFKPSTLYVYRNRHALDRVFLISSVQPAENERQMLEQIQAADLNSTAIVETHQKVPSMGGLSFDDEAKVTKYGNGRLEVQTRSKHNRLAVISEVWHPGWRARLDGVDVPILRTNYTMMGVWVGPGEHKLILDFKPMYWTPAIMISIITGAIFLLSAARKLVFRSKHVSSNP